MKKILLSVFAVAALASCFQNEDIVSTSDSNAIKFDSYVGNTTKAIDPSLTKATLHSFQVWGTTQGDHTDAAIVPIFEDVNVNNNNGNGPWAYHEDYTQYWIPGNTYNFAAVVNGNVDIEGKTVVTLKNGLPATIEHSLTPMDNYNDRDLLYATYGPYEAVATNNPKASFTFKHLLSKAVFSFVNNSAEPSKNIYVVKDIKIRNCRHIGTYDVATETWTTVNTSTLEKQFGDIVAANDATDAAHINSNTPLQSKYERFLLPGTFDAEITCTIELYLNGEVKSENLADRINYSHTIDLKLKPGHSYNFALSAGLNDQILFDVTEVEGWKPAMTPNPGTPDHNN